MQDEFQELVPGSIWVKERSLWFSGVRLRARTTVVRLDDGRLLIHSPSEPDSACRAALDRLGEVSWIVIPNRFHHLQAPATKAAYPRAEVLGPGSAKARNALVSLDRTIDDPHLASSLPGFRLVHLDGVPFLDETLLFHEPTGTLIGADLMMCGCASDHWTWRWSSRLFGQYERHRAPPDVRWNTRGSEALRRSFDQLDKLPVARVLVAHSAPVVDRPLEQLREAWRFALP